MSADLKTTSGSFSLSSTFAKASKKKAARLLLEELENADENCPIRFEQTVIVEPSPTNRKPWPYCGQLARPMARVVVMYSPRGAAVSGSQWTGRDSATWGTATAAKAAGTTATYRQEGQIISGGTFTVRLQRDSTPQNNRREHESTACGLNPKDPDIRRQTHAEPRRQGHARSLRRFVTAATRVCLQCLLLQHLLLFILRA